MNWPRKQAFLTDMAGVVHRPAVGTPRIVSLVPSVTELLFEMGLGPHIVGRTHYCVHPADEVESVVRLGGTKKIRMDRLKALDATHVIMNIDENPREIYDAIRAAGLDVIVTHPQSPEDNLSLYRLMGDIFDRQKEAARLSQSLNAALQEIRQRFEAAAPQRVLYLIWKDPWMTVGQETYISRLLDLVHWQTVSSHNEKDIPRYPEVSLTPEFLASVDLILLSSEPFPFTAEHATAFALEHGIDKEKLRLVDGEYLSWYGSRAIAGIHYLADLANCGAAAGRS